MAECISCGSADFHLVNSEYYCSMCHTLSQSHGLDTQHADEEIFRDFTRGARINLRKQNNEVKEKKKPQGRPWKTHEAFQYILKQQVHDLIKLGVDPEIENVVLRLWILFLQKCEIAFYNEPPDPDKLRLKRLCQHTRDKYLGSLKDPLTKPVPWRVTRYKKKLMRKTKSERDEDEARETLKEEFYEEDNPNEKPLDDFEVFYETKEKDAELYNQRFSSQIVYDDEGMPVITKVQGKHVKQKTMELCGKLHLVNIIGLLYIALQYVANHVLPHDLVRWMKECKLQYNRTELPEDMKFSCFDYTVFYRSNIPPPRKIVKEAVNLIGFLGLKDLPEVDITFVAHRFIIELGLPGELHAIVANLIQIKPPSVRLRQSFRYTSTANFACLAMAYIVITMKMIFGLDDVTEWKITQYAQVLSSFIDFEQPLFIWSDWVSYLEKQMSAERAKWFPEEVKDVRDIENIDLVFKNFDSIKGKLARRSEARSNLIYYSKKQEPLLNCLRDIYRESQKRNKKRSDISSSDRATDDADKDEEVEEENYIDHCNDHLTQDENSRFQSVTSCNRQLFQNSTLQYIIEPETFISALAQTGQQNMNENESQFTEPMSYVHGDDDDDDSEFNPSWDMFSDQHRKQRDCPSLKQPKKHNQLKKPGTTLQEIFESLPFLPAEFPKAYENYVLFEIPDDKKLEKLEPCMDVYPQKVVTRYESYNWLLKACSSHINEESVTLDEYVQRLELIHLPKSTRLDKRDTSILWRFTEKCFSKQEQ